MRDRTLKVFQGGAQPEEPVCSLCLEALGEDDAQAIHEHMQSLNGRVSICQPHKEVLLHLGYRFGPVVEESTRKAKRMVQSAARRVEKRKARLRALEPTPAPPKPDGDPFAF